MLHCQTSTSLIDDSSTLNKVMKLLFCEQTTPWSWQGVYFLTSTVKVGAVRLAHCYIVIRVVGIIIDYVFMKTLLIL